MKVRISITADNGDTLVETREIDTQLMQFTPLYSATLIWELMFKSIVEMVRVFQEVEDKNAP